MAISKMAWALALPIVATSVVFAGSAAAQQRPQSNANETYQAPSQQDGLRTAATAINAQKSEFFRQRNAVGYASLYTADATYVQLLPLLQVLHGRAQIQKYVQAIFDANATETQSTVTSADMIDANREVVGGDYSLTAGNRRILGHFVQVLRREDGTWRIASHVFARTQPLTVAEKDEYRGNQ